MNTCSMPGETFLSHALQCEGTLEDPIGRATIYRPRFTGGHCKVPTPLKMLDPYSSTIDRVYSVEGYSAGQLEDCRNKLRRRGLVLFVAGNKAMIEKA